MTLLTDDERQRQLNMALMAAGAAMLGQGNPAERLGAGVSKGIAAYQSGLNAATTRAFRERQLELRQDELDQRERLEKERFERQKKIAEYKNELARDWEKWKRDNPSQSEQAQIEAYRATARYKNALAEYNEWITSGTTGTPGTPGTQPKSSHRRAGRRGAGRVWRGRR